MDAIIFSTMWGVHPQTGSIGKGQKSPSTVQISGFFCLPWLLLRLSLLSVTGISLWLGPGLSIRIAAIVLLGIPATIADSGGHLVLR